MKLGMIDWGIGGIGVYKRLRDELGQIPVVYFSDTGATPYGKQPRKELTDRLNAVIKFLKDKGVTHIFIGCNAASTAVNEIDKQGLIIEGTIESAVAMCARLKPEKLAVIGGRRTIVSQSYRKAFKRKNIEILQRIAQPLSALIERGELDSDELRKSCAKIFRPIKRATHLLLACTHYPAISGVVSEFMSPETVVIDPSVEMISVIKNWSLPIGGKDVFYTTGDARQMKTAAKAAFGVTIPKVERIIL